MMLRYFWRQTPREEEVPHQAITKLVVAGRTIGFFGDVTLVELTPAEKMEYRLTQPVDAPLER